MQFTKLFNDVWKHDRNGAYNLLSALRGPDGPVFSTRMPWSLKEVFTGRVRSLVLAGVHRQNLALIYRTDTIRRKFSAADTFDSLMLQVLHLRGYGVWSHYMHHLESALGAAKRGAERLNKAKPSATYRRVTEECMQLDTLLVVFSQFLHANRLTPSTADDKTAARDQMKATKRRGMETLAALDLSLPVTDEPIKVKRYTARSLKLTCEL